MNGHPMFASDLKDIGITSTMRLRRKTLILTLIIAISLAYAGCATTGRNFYSVQCANDIFVITPLSDGGALVDRDGEEFFAKTSPEVVTNFIDADVSFDFDDNESSWRINSSSLEILVPNRDVELVDLNDPSSKRSCRLTAGTS